VSFLHSSALSMYQQLTTSRQKLAVTPQPRPIALSPGIALLLHSLPKVVDTLIELPLSHDGGPSDFTCERKLLELGWMLVALRNLSWSWPRLEEYIDRVRREVDMLQAVQAFNVNAGDFGLMGGLLSNGGALDVGVVGTEPLWPPQDVSGMDPLFF
jgi:hypothetical protein